VADISCSELEYELREFHGHRGKVDWALKVLNLVKESSGVLLCVDDRTLNVPHRSFQEYLAAVHLASEGKPEQIVELAKAAEHWHEVILLAAGYLVQEAKQSTVVAWVRKLLPAQRRTPEDGTLLKLAGEALSVIPRNWFERDRWDREFLEHVQRQLARTATSRGGVTPQERTALGVVLGRLGDPRPGVGLKNGLPDIAWVDVPAGPFLMGSDKEKDPEAWDDETEQFTCELIQEPYRISRYPITVAQFKAFVDAHGYELPDEYWTDSGRAWLRDSEARGPRAYGGVFETLNHPKVGVNWYEAMAFCSWLSEMTGQTITLPTEAQWEMAARGTDGRIYPWGNGFDPRYCNTRESQIGATSAVGLFPKGDSPCGASDTSGNVLEWCSTKWLSDYKGYDRKADDTREGDSSRVLRGGSFSIVRGGVRCACRYYDHPDGQYDGIGFRVASPGL
jgi:formylglycine-generating enzyme required for sulfatase activity